MADYGKLQEVVSSPRSAALTAAALTSDTELELDSAGDLDPDGGTISLNGTQFDYSGIVWGSAEDDPDVVTLVDPLADAADLGDLVVPVLGGLLAEDWYGVVDMGDGDPVMVPITFYQRSSWLLGMYDPAVRVQVSDDLQHLEDAPGRTVLPSSGTAELARITVYMGIDYGVDIVAMTEGSTGRSRNVQWDQVDEDISVGVGTAFIVSETTTQITVTQPGIYAVSWSTYLDDVVDARTTSSLGLQAAPDWTDNAYDAYLMGGHPDGTSDVGSFTYYISQAQIDSGNNDISFYVTWQDLDVSNMNGNYFEAMIQQIVSSAAPTQPSPPPLPNPAPSLIGAYGDLVDFTVNDQQLLTEAIHLVTSQDGASVIADDTGTLNTFKLKVNGTGSPGDEAKVRFVTGSWTDPNFVVTGVSAACTVALDDAGVQTFTVAPVAVNAGDYLALYGVAPAGSFIDPVIAYTNDPVGDNYYNFSVPVVPAPSDSIALLIGTYPLPLAQATNV